jgi:hypothetical protein
VRSCTVGEHWRRLEGFRSWWRGGRGAAGRGECDGVLEDIDCFLEQRGGAAGEALASMTFDLRRLRCSAAKSDKPKVLGGALEHGKKVRK